MSDFTQLLPDNIPLDMVFVEGGDFDMGGADKEADADEKPVHPVRLRSFFIGKYPLTQAQWKAVMGADNNPSNFKGDRRPVENVSWFDAAVFCNALSEMTKKEPCYFSDAGFKKPFGKTDKGWDLPNRGEVFLHPTAAGYRLPSEAEWEYAARGGHKMAKDPSRMTKYAGSDKLKEVAWYNENSFDETKPVGLKYPNELGIYDMSGNVWEWCGDWFSDKYYQECLQKGTVENPNGPPTGSNRVYRGGGCFNLSRRCRAAARLPHAPESRNSYRGFRPLLSFQADGQSGRSFL